MNDNFLLDKLMNSQPSKCKIDIPCLTSLKKNVILEYIDKNLIGVLKDYKVDSARIRIRWQYKMFDSMTLEDCWKYAHELMYHIFEFRKLFKEIFIICSFATYTGKRNNKNGVNYGMPIIRVLLIHKSDDIVNMLINFIKKESKFETIYNFPVVVRDPCAIFKYMFYGNNHKYILKMIPDHCSLYWFSTIESLSSFMNIVTSFNKNKKNRIISEELKFEN